MPQIVLTRGGGFGEETKGAAVEWLCEELHAGLVIRSGGCQAAHHIVLSSGNEHCFTHFGCGTFQNVPTLLMNMVLSPDGLYHEACELEAKGVKNIFALISVHHQCLIISPFHSAMSHLREILRGNEKKGTIGKGVGEAITDSDHNPEVSIRAGELGNFEVVFTKIEAFRKLKLQEAYQLLEQHTEKTEELLFQLSILEDEVLAAGFAKVCVAITKLVQVLSDAETLALLNEHQHIVGEASHGLLLDRWQGFVPHVTQVDPSARELEVALREIGFDGEIRHFHILRSYFTRHGAGPLVSHDPQLDASLCERHNNVDNDWLGPFRAGHFDLVALRYALGTVDGNCDGLIMSYLDALETQTSWQLCTAYRCDDLPRETLAEYFVLDEHGLLTEIRVRKNTRDSAQLTYQTHLTNILKKCQPVLEFVLQNEGESLTDDFLRSVELALGYPVVAGAWGPRKEDRRVLPGRESLIQ